MHEILLVEYDPSLRAGLVHALSDRGYRVVAVDTLMDALRVTTVRVPDVVVLDLGQTDLDGGAVLRVIQGMGSMPIIAVTTRTDERTLVNLLNSGANDFIVRPFLIDQLAARISVFIRHSKARRDASETVVEVGGLHIDRRQRVARLDGRTLDLRRLEFDLLSYLGDRAGLVVTRQELSRNVWQRLHTQDDQTIDVHMSWLRRKLGEGASRPRYLHTIRGVGFKLAPPK